MPTRKGEWRTPIADRFWPKVNKTETCWLWTGATNSQGYGQTWDGDKVVYAHRVSYEMAKGPIPTGLPLDHLCRTPLCVNPDHLEAVTHQVNSLRGEGLAPAKAAQTHCVNGHPFDEANTYHRPDRKTGNRMCKQCARDREKRKKGLSV